MSYSVNRRGGGCGNARFNNTDDMSWLEILSKYGIGVAFTCLFNEVTTCFRGLSTIITITKKSDCYSDGIPK